VQSAECVTFGDGYCDYISRCAQFLLKFAFADMASCKDRLGIACTLSEQSPGAAKVPAACGTALKALTCTDDANPASCAVQGTLVNGTICEFDLQCQSSSCIKPSDSKCGVCKATLAQNAACGPSLAACATGLVCVNSVCRPTLAKDANCTGVPGTCKAPYRCVGGTCKDPSPLNGPCTKNSTADDDSCNTLQAQFCKTVGDAGTGTCTGYTFGNLNEACGFTGTDFVFCAGGLDCVSQPTGGQKCVTKLADGTACNADGGVDCQIAAECINGKCGFPDPTRCK
jgi:hypothetical protein